VLQKVQFDEVATAATAPCFRARIGLDGNGSVAAASGLREMGNGAAGNYGESCRRALSRDACETRSMSHAVQLRANQMTERNHR
jgi:hypothetical protein